MTDASVHPGPTLRDLFELGRTARAEASPSALSELVSVEVKDAAIEPGVLWEGIVDQLDTLLDIEAAAVIAGAWSKAQQLQEYRDPDRHPPEELSTVSLSEHTVRSRYHPSIELLVNEQRVQSLGVDIGLQLTVEALILEIRNARIVAVRPGRCRMEGRISIKDHPLADLKSRTVEIPGRCALGEGIEIPELERAE